MGKTLLFHQENHMGIQDKVSDDRPLRSNSIQHATGEQLKIFQSTNGIYDELNKTFGMSDAAI